MSLAGFDHVAVLTRDLDAFVVFIEVGPVGPMRQFGDHAKRVLGQT